MANHTIYNNVSILRGRLHRMASDAHDAGQHREFLAALVQTLEAELNDPYNKSHPFTVPLEHMARVLLAATRVVGAITPELQYMLDQLQLARDGFIAEHPETAQEKEPAIV